MPAALSDIHPDSPEQYEPNLHFRLFKRTITLRGDAGPTLTYFIKAGNSPDGQIVMLHDAATVLECFRQSIALADMIRFLFLNGQPFRTFLPKNLISQPQPERVQLSPTPGHYAPKYKPGLHEYRYYEQLRKEFCSLPHAHAALERGNIIWRLAMDSIGAPAEEIICDGPSQQALTHGSHVQDPESSDQMWSDDLSEAEMDVMCGVYKVFTGECPVLLCHQLYFNRHLGNKNQVASLSWWPKEGVFINSGLWPGYWLHSCEDWFQTQYNHIVEQHLKHGIPRISNHWQNSLKLEKRVKQLRIANIAVAAQYLGLSDST